MRWRLWGLAAGILAVAILVGWLVWPGPSRPEAREREYLDFDACLLVGEGGLVRDPGAATWAGMRDASTSTRVRVSYVEVLGDQNSESAEPYLAGLVNRKCSIVLAGDKAPVDAVTTMHSEFNDVSFITVGGIEKRENMTTIAVDENTREAVKSLIIRHIPHK